jgi:riboflavin kinase
MYSTRPAAISIGFNPTYGNDKKTVEPHLIAPANHERRHASSCGETIFQDFYNQPVRLSVIGYLRPELPFEGLDKLITAIKQDIRNTEKLSTSQEEFVLVEKQWVDSDKDVGE